MSRRTIDSVLNPGLNNPNPLVRAMSLKGLSSSLMQPQKVRRQQGGGFREEEGAVEKSLRGRSHQKGWMSKAQQAGAGQMGRAGDTLLHCAAPRVLDVLDRKGLSDFEVRDPGLLSR